MATEYAFSAFTLDVSAGELRHRGEVLSLEPKAFDVLTVLVRNRHRVVPVDELLTTCWSDTSVERGSVHRAISLLRNTLAKEAEGKGAIQTLARKGYRFRLDVTGGDVPESAPTAAATPQTTYVGREDILTALDERLAHALNGNAEFALLHGPPGIGKSMTLARLVERARAGGAVVLEGHCIEGPGASPYRPWSRMLRGSLENEGPAALKRGLGFGAEAVAQAIPELGSALGFKSNPDAPGDLDQGARYRVRDAIADWIRDASKASGLLLVLDDLHRADLDSIQLLAYLLQELKNERVLLATAYREGPDAERIHDELDRIVALRPKSPVQLAEFSREEVEAFVHDRAGEGFGEAETAALLDRTGGNPLFLEQLLRSRDAGREGSGSDPRHVGLRGALRRLLDDTSERCSALLEFACLFGREFESATLAAGLGWSPTEIEDALAEACDLRILEREHEGFGLRFVHGLIPEVLFAEVPAARRPALHQRVIAGLLATRKGPRDRLGELAYHAQRAASLIGHGEAFAHTFEAARDAARRLAFDDAVGHFEQALALPAPAENDRDYTADHARCLVELGNALVLRGEGREAAPRFVEACELARELDDPIIFASAALGPTTVDEYDAVDADQIAILNEAVERLGDRDKKVRLELLIGVARLGYLSDSERTLAASEEALALARELDDASLLCDALVVRADALGWTNRREECLALVEEADRLAHRRPVPPLVKGLVLRQVAFEALVRGDRSAYERQLRELHAIARTHRLSLFDWRVSAMKTTLALSDGLFEEARSMIQEQFEQGKHSNPKLALSMAAVQLAVIGLAAGDPAQVASSMKAFLDAAEGLIAWHSPLTLALASSGQFEEAKREAGPLVRSKFEPRHRDYLPMVLACFADAAQMMGDEKLAKRVGEELAELPDRFVVLGLCLVAYGSVDRYRGLCAEVTGDLDAAIDFYRKGLEVDHDMGAQPMVASGSYDLGRALAARGNPEDLTESEEQLQFAYSLAKELGMERLADRIRG